MNKKKMMDYVRSLFPEAVFTWKDGKEICYHDYHGISELHFYESAYRRDNYTFEDGEMGCCLMTGGKMLILNVF